MLGFYIFYSMWMRFSQVVRASGCQCQSRNSPGFDPSILRHRGIWGAADDAVMNNVHKKKKLKKFLLSILFTARQPFEVLLAEQSSDEENQETSSVISKWRNAGMQEKVSPASAFLPVVSCFSLASAFRHQGSVRYRWSRISPALPSYGVPIG